MLHVLLMFSLPWLLTPPRSSSALSEDRTVGIVLARANQQKTEYLQPTDAVEAAQDSSTSDALPDHNRVTELTLPELALPTDATPRPDLPDLPGPQATDVRTQRRVPGGIDAEPILAAEARRRAAIAAAGPEAQVSLFGGGTASGRSFVFLIDRSKSMGKQGLGALEAAEQELLRSLRGLQTMHRFQVIAYHHKCVYLNKRKLLKATPENIQAIEGHLGNLAAFGATEHEQAIMSALYHKPDVIFLLTDGGDPALTAGQRQRIRRVAGGRTSIHCIQFGFGPRQESGAFLERLAAENRGSYGYLDMSPK
jgi:Ca-activated chloride channel family protein